MTDLTASYAAAEGLLPYKLKELILNAQLVPRWIGTTERFWYTGDTGSGTRYMLVDPEPSQVTEAFDHDRVAEALTSVLGAEVAANALPISGLEPRAEALRLATPSGVFDLDLETYALKRVEGVAAPSITDIASPDGKHTAFLRDHNVWVRDAATGVERQLTGDGEQDHAYATAPDATQMRSLLDQLGVALPPILAWSPDSSRIITHQLDQRGLPYLHYVQSAPVSGGRPEHRAQRYAMVGEPEVTTGDMVVLDIQDGTAIRAKDAPIIAQYASPFALQHVWWSSDSQFAYWLDWGRGNRSVALREIDPATGVTRILVEEHSDSWVDVYPIPIRANVHVLADRAHAIWWSERDGWGHLYLIDTDTGRPVRQLTQGQWLVRDLVGVDEQAGVVYFTASGREAGLDPYLRQLYRVPLHGGEPERLTHDELDHEVLGSPSARTLVDTASRWDIPPTHVLRVDGAVLVELERADVEKLLEAGWTPPERFCVKAADDTTDIYGLLFRPHGFDENGSYPVLDEVYPGPQIPLVSVSFPRSGLGINPAQHSPAMAGLGFAVINVDGRGTPMRSRAFHTDMVRGLGQAGHLDDHIAALRQLSQSRPWLDLDRVGIFGHSGGGTASAQALLDHPDFYKVAVSSAGAHDARYYHVAWGEIYHGDPSVVDYADQDSAAHVHKLVGKLLLIHGEIDDNVPPYQTLRLVDAFMKADKDVDLLIIPGADHGLFNYQAHWLRRRWDYFVRHLMGVEPPAYKLAPIPMNLEALVTGLGG